MTYFGASDEVLAKYAIQTSKDFSTSSMHSAAQFLVNYGFHKEAAAIYHDLADKHPYFPENYNLLANSLKVEGHYKLAEENYLTAIELSRSLHEKVKYQNNLAMLYIQFNRNLVKARKLLENISISIEASQFSWWLFWLGRLNELEGLIDDATFYYNFFVDVVGLQKAQQMGRHTTDLYDYIVDQRLDDIHHQ